jgi:hypothetical protein
MSKMTNVREYLPVKWQKLYDRLEKGQHHNWEITGDGGELTAYVKGYDKKGTRVTASIYNAYGADDETGGFELIKEYADNMEEWGDIELKTVIVKLKGIYNN